MSQNQPPFTSNFQIIWSSYLHKTLVPHVLLVFIVPSTCLKSDSKIHFVQRFTQKKLQVFSYRDPSEEQLWRMTHLQLPNESQKAVIIDVMKPVGKIASKIWPVVLYFTHFGKILTLGHWMRLIGLYRGIKYEVCRWKSNKDMASSLVFFIHF